MYSEDQDPLKDLEFLQFVMESRGEDPSQFSKEELDAIYLDYKGQREALTEQQGRADALRNAQLKGGYSHNGLFVADNPLSLLGVVGQQYGGAKMQDRIDEKRESLSEQDAMARQAYAREMANSIRSGTGGRPGNVSTLTPEQLEHLRGRSLRRT